MFHLHPRIGFHEVEAILFRFHQKLEGADAVVFHFPCQRQGAVDNAIAQGRFQPRCRSKFHQLLVAALQGAIALPQMTHRPTAIAQHLHFNMPGGAYQLLHIDGVITKGGLRFRLTTGIGGGQIGRVSNRSHTASATTTQGLDHHATAIQRGHEGLGLFQRHCLIRALHQRHLATRRQRPGCRLVAKQPQRVSPRPDQCQPCLGTRLGKGHILGEKPVTGMNRLTAMFTGNGNQLRAVQIRRHAPARQRDGLIHLTHVQGRLIILGKHPQRTDTQIRTGVGNTDGDLASVGNQDGSKGGGHGELQSRAKAQRPQCSQSGGVMTLIPTHGEACIGLIPQDGAQA